MMDDEKLSFDLTTKILDMIKEEVGFSQVDPFTMRYLREEIQAILLKHIDLAEERFEQAFEEGESKGFAAGKLDMKERLLDFLHDN